jgi:hypothetical protein
VPPVVATQVNGCQPTSTLNNKKRKKERKKYQLTIFKVHNVTDKQPEKLREQIL